MDQKFRINGICLRADTINGVYQIDSTCDIAANEETSTAQHFVDSLKDLADGEYVIAFFDGDTQELFDRVNSEYGIELLTR